MLFLLGFYLGTLAAYRISMNISDDSKQDHERPQRRVKRPRFDRALMICILVVQCVILAVLFHRYVTDEPEVTTTAAVEESNPPAGDPVLAPPPGRQAGLAGDFRPVSLGPQEADQQISTFLQAFFIRPPVPDHHFLHQHKHRPAYDRRHGFPLERVIELAFHDMERLDDLMDFDKVWPVLRPSPAMDMRDDENHYLVAFSVPGLDAPELTVTLNGRLLTISGESQPRDQYQTVTFSKRVWLPGPVQHAKQAQARLTNGILRVMVPKADVMPRDSVPMRLL